MAERIILDPTEVAVGRVQFDITPWISDAGVDWGDGDIQAYMADLDRGSVPVDYRIPNRTITVPLKLITRGGTAFATARSTVQAKAALFQRRGGSLKRVTASGGTVYADVVNATVKLPGSWSQAMKDYDTEAELTLEALPDFYGDEVTLADHVETSAAELIFTEPVDGPGGVTSGLELWLKPESLGADTTAISSWPDSSGLGNNAVQATGANQPVVAAGALDGFKTARFDGGSDFLAAAGITNNDPTRTVFIVAKAAVAGADDRVWSIAGQAQLQTHLAGGNQWAWNDNAANANVGIGGTPTNWQVVTTRFNSTASADFFINGGAAANLDPNDGYQVADGVTFKLGSNFNGSGNFFGGDVVEVVIFNSALSNADKDKIIGYLSNKYPTLGSFGTTPTATTIKGDYPARVRMVVDEDQGQAQTGLLWGFRNLNYSSASTARLAYEAEALQPLDTAARAGLSGASGGTVVTHGTLATNWTPVLDMRSGGTAYPTHVGTYRWLCRYRTTSGTAVQLRGVWDVGDMVFPAENSKVRSNSGTEFYVADLGELRLDPPPVGTHRWNGIIQAKGDAGGENVSLDRVWFQPVDESAGLLKAGVTLSPGLAPHTARDEFNQTAGALTGKTAPVGGVWIGAGDADDFTIDTSGHTAQRTAISDVFGGEDTARLAVSGVAALTAQINQVDFKLPSIQTNDANAGVIARYVDVNNFLNAHVTINSSGNRNLNVVKRVASVDTNIAGGVVSILLPSFAVATWYTLKLYVDTAGQWFVWYGAQGSASLALLASGKDAVLATGGALASGKPGFMDRWGSANAGTRNYDNFLVFVPTSDAVLFASQSAELRWDGMYRKDTSGSAYGPVSWVEGDLPRLPPGGTTEVFVKASRGDFDAVPDSGIDDVSARLTYRPCWVFVPDS